MEQNKYFSNSEPSLIVTCLPFLQVFEANTDAITAVTSIFPAPVYVRIVRITVLSMSSNLPRMRFELLGCKM